MDEAVTSAQAETAISRVWLAVAAFDRAQHFIGSEDRIWWERDDLGQMCLTSISEVAAVTEGFVVDSLLGHMRIECSAVPPQISKIVTSKLVREIEATWEARNDFSNKWLNAGFGSTSWWAPLQGFVNARNAWAHGLGRLTDMQLRNEQSVKGFLREAGLQVVNNVVAAEPKDVRRCGTVAVEAISWVDRSVRR